ncbi:MAG: GDSL-type esterase/lipase family protein [Actinomycetota bacterium]|nr:GDSL-type esterase/lipase family protein [Actinomycetota bacterium]
MRTFVRPRLVLAAAVPLAGISLAGMGLLTAQALYAARRRLPYFPDLDPSGKFGQEEARALRVVAMGDSTVTGPGLDEPDPIWVRQVARHLAEGHRVELLSIARGGARVRDVLADQVPKAVALQPDLVLLSVGGNDALRGTPLRRLEQELDQVVSRLTSAGAAVALLGVGDLGTIPRLPRTLAALARLRGRLVDAVEARVAARYPGVAKADSWGASVTEAFRRRGELFSPDLFHVSARGHSEWAALAIPAVEKALLRLQPSEGEP